MAKGWTTANIGGKPADVYEPPAVDKPGFGVLHLHGGSRETLRDNPEFSRLFEELKLGCVCPHGQCSWWTSFADISNPRPAISTIATSTPSALVPLMAPAISLVITSNLRL